MSFVITALAVSATANAVVPATLIDADVNRVPVRFVSLTGGRLHYFDADRRLTQQPIDTFVGIRFDADPAVTPAEAGPPLPTVRLADGHVVAGKFAGIDADGFIRWRSASLGELAIKLDDVAAFTVDEAVGPTPPMSGGAAADDAVELTNGDRLTGFVTAIDDKQLTLKVADQPLPLAWDRIRRVALANPVRRAPGVWLTLTDGSRLRIDSVNMDGQRLKATAFGERAIDLPIAQVRGLDFAAVHRLVPIGDAEATVTGGGVVFGVPTPPRIEAESAKLHAPIVVSFALPEGARRFAASASLDPADLEWADLVLIVADGKGELARHHLGPDKPSVQVNVALRDRTLLLTLDPAINGPVRDRLTLSHAAVLVEDAE